MSDFPDANVGGLDITGAARPKAPLSKRVRAYTIIVALYAGILGMAGEAVRMLRSVFRAGEALDNRALHLFYAAGLLVPLVLVVNYFVRLRVKTGRWRGTPEQRAQEREQRRGQCSTANGCSARKATWSSYIVKWASCTAMDRALPTSQRIAAWVVLALYVLAMLALVVIGLICFGMAFGVDDQFAACIVFVVAGFAMLFWPARAVVSLVRGVRAGKVGATRGDLEEIRTQRNAQREREWQKPMRSKLISTAISCAGIGFLWIRAAVQHTQHRHADWVSAALWTPALVYSIWIQFRSPKNVTAPNEGPPTIDA